MGTKDIIPQCGKATSPKEQPFRFLVEALPGLKGKRTRSHQCPPHLVTIPAPMIGGNVSDMCSGTYGIGAPHVAYGGLVIPFLKN